MHLGTADQLFPGQQLILGEHLFIPRVAADPQHVRIDQRNGSRGRGTEAERLRDCREFTPQVHQVGTQVEKIGTGTAVGFHHGLQQLCGEAVGWKAVKDRAGPRYELAGREIEDVKLLLDADSRDSVVAHGRRRYGHSATEARLGLSDR